MMGIFSNPSANHISFIANVLIYDLRNIDLSLQVHSGAHREYMYKYHKVSNRPALPIKPPQLYSEAILSCKTLFTGQKLSWFDMWY